MSLVVYKSSAGSGKTHTLVLEYLLITLQDPGKYRRVLAITFTNKAAGEMKERIISTLRELSGGETDNEMARSITGRLKFTPEQLISRAAVLLSNIIHHYEDFGISTIDSFVHRIIRTFTNDVKLPYGFEVVIDDDDIIPDIIEDLYDKLGEESALTKIMIEFVLSLTDDEKSYNPESMLVDFIKKQTREEGFEEIKKLEKLSLERFLTIITSIGNKLNTLKKEINTAAAEAMMLLKSNGLEPAAFFQGNRGLPSYFKKNLNKINAKTLIPASYAQRTISDDKWYGGKTTPADKAAIEAIKERLINYFNIIEQKGRNFLLLKIIYDKLYAVALTREIRRLFDEFTVRTNKVHISDFNKKISDSIAGQPAPFIYERLGNHYDHFLIDEFQDTSLLQWYNLLPLIENSLASGNFNMLVGDAKQAIYRFRGGEVELFTGLPLLYGKPDLPYKAEREKLLKESFKEKILDTNYRSYKEIVEFNNRFFNVITNTEDHLIKNIYNNHRQKISPGKKSGGYVSIQLIDHENTGDYKTKRLDAILHYVNNLKEKGFAYSDICILTRNKSETTEDASWLLSNNIPVISSESLLLTGSPEVRATTALIKSLLEPENPVALAELLENLVIIKNQQQKFEELSLLFCRQKNNGLKAMLQWAGIDMPVELLKQKPVYQLAETLYNYLNPENKPNIRFQYFLDFIIEKEAVFENRPDVFLELWEQKKEKLYIIMPDGEDAVRLMTIHKAKGLKFQAVIVDFQDRLNRNTKNEFWTDINLPEFPDLTTTLLPIQKEKLTAIGYQEVYQHEQTKTRLDFLNLVYVAFTRPVEALFILAEAPKKGNKEIFSKTINSFLKETGDYNENTLHYQYGTLAKYDKAGKPSGNHLPLTKWTTNGGDFPVKTAPAEEIYWEMAGTGSHRVKGKLIHEILSHIKTVKDIDKTLNLYASNGVIDDTEFNDLKQETEIVVNHPLLKDFFSEKANIKTETEIILPGGDLIRPDRVVLMDNTITVIDYKTGEKENKHLQQIKNYKDAFSEEGYDKVNGLLVYLGNNMEIINV